MATEASNLDSPGLIDTSLDRSGIVGHPRGLMTLFFTEMWERFSYYGMRALLILYMTTAVANGGMGLDTRTAAIIYGAYTGSVYLMSIPGGWIADNVLGTRHAVLVGGIIIALGHFCMATPLSWTFFTGLILIVLGTGLLKPNVSVIVGSLYSENDERRDAGFSIFYMGINLGAGIAPIICSFLGEKINWHLGFGAAGIGMTFGIIQYVAGRKRLEHVGHPPALSSRQIKRNGVIGVLFLAGVILAIILLYFGPESIQRNRMWIMISGVVIFLIWMFAGYLKPEERKPVAVIVLLFLFSVIFWASFEQSGSSFNLFARDFTDRNIFGREFPAGWYQSVNAILLVSLAPLFSLLWLGLGNRQPSSPAKFSIGLLFVGLGAATIALASTFIGNGNRVGPWWLIGVYIFLTFGELCLSPIGLSTTTKLAPERLSGLMMGVWFLSISFGNFAAGEAASYFEGGSQEALVGLFSKLAIVPIISGVILMLLTPYIKKLMGKVR